MASKKVIKMEWLKTVPGQRYWEKNSQRPYFICSDNGFWRRESKGYSDNPHHYGVYSLTEAYKATQHCGPEKEVRYIPVSSDHFINSIAYLSDTVAYLSSKHKQFYK